MCGIAGVFSRSSGIAPDDRLAVQRMTDALVHRGPDSGGSYADDHVALGSRRLSIIDLSESGAMPMTNETGEIWVTYNGEIYNHSELREQLKKLGHTFRSNADTEVVIHGYEQWGPAGLLERLEGMFAFAIYDKPQKRLFLARDRFGIKPLYFSTFGDRIVFASEVRAMRRCGLIPTDDDTEAMVLFLLFGSVPAPRTTLNSIRILPPGHFLLADRNGIRTEQYYSLDRLFEDDAPQNAAIGAQQIRSELERAVDSHMISDAPIGVFLSGGLDSTALVALAARHKPDLQTLSVVFGEDGYSEEPYQTIVANRFKTVHHRINVSLDDFHHKLEQFVSRMDVPTVDGLNTYLVAEAAGNVGLKAVLSGLGADEVFAGYGTLGRARTLSRLHMMPKPVFGPLYGLVETIPHYKKLAFLEKGGAIPLYLCQRGLFTPRQTAKLLDTEESQVWKVMASLEPAHVPDNPRLQQQFLEARHYLTDQLLRDSDVFGMAHSVEIRVPFLDRKLVECALSAPLASRWPNGVAKPLLARAVGDLIPKEVVGRTKQGFNLPMKPWLLASEDHFREPGSRFSRKAYESVWKEFMSGRVHWSRPWALAVLAASKGGQQ